MYLSLWVVNVNGRNEEFATNSSNIEEALQLFKPHFKNKYPDKAFNVESIKRVTGIEFLSETTTE